MPETLRRASIGRTDSVSITPSVGVSSDKGASNQTTIHGSLLGDTAPVPLPLPLAGAPPGIGAPPGTGAPPCAGATAPAPDGQSLQFQLW